MSYIFSFLEEFHAKADEPKTFADYYSKKYKEKVIPYYLWEAELMFYAAKYFRKDPAETVINEAKLTEALDKYAEELKSSNTIKISRPNTQKAPVQAVSKPVIEKEKKVVPVLDKVKPKPPVILQDDQDIEFQLFEE